MCGIIGYIGGKPAGQVLLDGLSRLEYRGYDSTGIAVMSKDNTVNIRKTPGKLSELKKSLHGNDLSGNAGIGHIRWATHGIPNELNAHPHSDCSNTVTIVHNGIVENYIELKQELQSLGHSFKSDTDSEVIAHLIEKLLQEGLQPSEATRQAATRLSGSHAVVAIFNNEPGILIAFRSGHAGGIIVGYSEGEMLLSSDLPAIISYTKTVSFLLPGEMVTISPTSAFYKVLQDGTDITKVPEFVNQDPVSIAKGGYEHFMLKEIFEQPQAIVSTMRDRVSFNPIGISLGDLNISDPEIANINRVIVTGMGTSLHSAIAGAHMVEKLSGIPCQAENASELRYRNPIIDSHTLVISVGQSGETADTLSAMEECANHGARLISICNVEQSQAARIANGTIYLRAGPEIGVASTKTFTCSLMAIYILAAHLGIVRGFLSKASIHNVVDDIATLPGLLGDILSNAHLCEEIAELYYNKPNFLYIGRGLHYPIALEGALKLKEISYIHAEGSPAGEMKHGPIALIDHSMPVVAIVPYDSLRDKMINNISEVKTRDGQVIAIATEGDRQIKEVADHVIYVPRTSQLLSPIVCSIPLQLLAYYIAVKRGCDIDQPRNLAKTVTVE